MKEKIKGKQLILESLKLSNEPISCEQIWTNAEVSGLSKLYAKGTAVEQKKTQICSLLCTWTKEENCPIIRHEKGYNEHLLITYELKKKFKNKIQLDKVFGSPSAPIVVEFLKKIDSYRESRPIITTQLRYKLWSKFWNNSMNGLCIVCGNPITIADFVCGHIEAWSVNKNSDISNLAPVCNLCNKSMGTMDMREYKKLHHSNIDVPCKTDIFKDYITKEDVIKCLEKYLDRVDAKYFEKALEIIKSK